MHKRSEFDVDMCLYCCSTLLLLGKNSQNKHQYMKLASKKAWGSLPFVLVEVCVLSAYERFRVSRQAESCLNAHCMLTNFLYQLFQYTLVLHDEHIAELLPVGWILQRKQCVQLCKWKYIGKAACFRVWKNSAISVPLRLWLCQSVNSCLLFPTGKNKWLETFPIETSFQMTSLIRCMTNDINIQ